jgi:hypothetical protein
MTLIPPNLDDRSFSQLVDEARQRAAQICPEWTDWSPSDPGATLVELFAYLTETMIYRLNRLPEKAYIEFLRLLGVNLRPPAAARVLLRFSGEPGLPATSRIPRGTRVATRPANGGESVTFITTEEAVLTANQPQVDIPAVHCELIQGEVLGVGTGLPGQSYTVARPPIVNVDGEQEDLWIGVQSTLNEDGEARFTETDGKVFRIWTPVEHFAHESDAPRVFTVDRHSGRITFAPAIRDYENQQTRGRLRTLAEVPGKGCEIRAWYRRGGGAAGNVAAGTLTQLLDPISGVKVDNPVAAVGGCDAESLENALVRGPQQLHGQTRAITARDYERIAVNQGAIARARAAAQAELWAHAEPGTVEVSLVPEISPAERQRGRLTYDEIRSRQSSSALEQLTRELDMARPLSTKVALHWIDYQRVLVKASIRVFAGEDPQRIQSQVRTRLNQFISPWSTPSMPQGWPFDQHLPAGRLYDEIFRVPGVREIDHLRLVVEEAPDQDIRSIAVDACQRSTWHVVAGDSLYRSLDNGQSWLRLDLPMNTDQGERLEMVRAHAGRAGYLAFVRKDAANASDAVEGAASRSAAAHRGSHVYYSADCGRSWQLALRTGNHGGPKPFWIHDLAWIQRDSRPALLLATSLGLYELDVGSGSLTAITLAGLPAETGIWAIAVRIDDQTRALTVAVAAQNDQGVWISHDGGKSRTFLQIGLKREDVRALHFQSTEQDAALWAGSRIVGNRPGVGCFRWTGKADSWLAFSRGWPGDAGSCLGLASLGSRIVAATYGGGIVWLDSDQRDAASWQTPLNECGLPRGRAEQRFRRLTALAVAPTTGDLLVGCDDGLFLSRDQGRGFQRVGQREFVDRVVLPRQSLFLAGDHDLTVEVDN